MPQILPDSIYNNYAIIDNDKEVLQTGAFLSRSNAFALYQKLGALTDQRICVVYEGGYYKVRVYGFDNRTIAGQFVARFAALGFQLFYYPTVKSNKSIQVGEYENEKDALISRDAWSKRQVKPVIILYDNGFYRVQVQGITSDQKSE